jgi:L-ascorbate metabolism protein UlaG (beta-lactamase superfamily)
MSGTGLGSASCQFAAPGHVGPALDNFDGRRFANQAPVQPKSFRDLLRWGRQRRPGHWRPYEEHPYGPAPPGAVGKGALRVTFINHSTVLLQLDGLNLLTDPIYSMRASPVRFAGPRRARNPGIRFEDLPTIHGVLLSHNHYDHLDLPTLRRLHKAHKPWILTGLGNGRLLAKAGIPGARELSWWDEVEVDRGVRVRFVPAQHWSGRGLSDRARTLWGGFVVAGSRHLTYFAGDTGFGPHFTQIRARYGTPDLALLPIGAYRPRWFMKDMHLDPAEAVEAHRQLGARLSVPIHFGTFPLGDDGQDAPVEELVLARAAAGLPDGACVVLGFGEGRDVRPKAIERSLRGL